MIRRLARLPARIRGLCIVSPLFVGAVFGQRSSEAVTRALGLIEQLDRPAPSVMLGADGSAGDHTGETAVRSGIAVGPSPGAAPPTELRQDRGRALRRGGLTLHALPGSPAELQVGETVFVGGGPLVPPREVFVGQRLRVNDLHLMDGDRAAEADIEYEDTQPGSGPVVRSGTQLRTRVRMQRGQRTPVFGSGGEREQESASGSLIGDRNGRTLQGGRTSSRTSTERGLGIGFDVRE